MATAKREKELARAKYERQQARRAASARTRQRNQRIIAIIVVAGLVLGSVGWVIASVTSTDEVVTQEGAEVASDEAAANESAANESAQTPPITLASCEEPVATREDNLSWAEAPAGPAQPGSLTLSTNCGDIVIQLDAENAPATVASAEFLATEGFYNATACHRLTTEGIFVLQCGDPAGNGTGGPGYVIPDENLPAEGAANYPAGTVAMANAGPGTGGSQFFIVYEDTTLPSGYTIWGKVTSGLEIVQSIASVGTAEGTGDGTPGQPVVIETATFTAS